MQEYHEIWLSTHPHRTREWLEQMLADGFDIHHIDGDHSNNDPGNLVLIESSDHMMLHNGSARIIRGMSAVVAGHGNRRKIETIGKPAYLKFSNGGLAAKWVEVAFDMSISTETAKKWAHKYAESIGEAVPIAPRKCSIDTIIAAMNM